MEYNINEDYPEIKVEKENKYYADLLLLDYAGIDGELTAITQYTYQDFYFFKKYPELAKIMSKIARVEMKHLELLGKTINLLGVKPEYKFKDNSPYLYMFWNGSYVNYKTNIIDVLKDNIIGEEIAINTYSKHLNIITDKYIKRLLERIIEDEKVHIKIFKDLMNTYKLNNFL